MLTWVITVGGGSRSFLHKGTEKQAEEMRRHKANWEHAVAHKRLASPKDIKAISGLDRYPLECSDCPYLPGKHVPPLPTPEDCERWVKEKTVPAYCPKKVEVKGR